MLDAAMVLPLLIKLQLKCAPPHPLNLKMFRWACLGHQCPDIDGKFDNLLYICNNTLPLLVPDPLDQKWYLFNLALVDVAKKDILLLNMGMFFAI